MSGIPVRNLYYLLCYAWGGLHMRGLVDLDADPADTPQDLLARLLVSATSVQLRRGLLGQYVAREEALRSPRARIDPSRTALRCLEPQGRAHCTYSELSADVLPNRLLAETLRRLLRARTAGGRYVAPRLRLQVRNLLPRLGLMTPVEPTPRAFAQVSLGAGDSSYRFLMQLCEMISRLLLPTPGAALWQLRDPVGSPQEMVLLFERFVGEFLSRESPHLTVRTGRQLHWPLTPDHAHAAGWLPIMRTDVEVRRQGRPLTVIECKFVREPFPTHHGRRRVISEHLQQLTAYLRAHEAEGRQVDGLLLYAKLDAHTDLRYRHQHGALRVKTVDLTQAWPAVHDQMLHLLD